MKSGRPSPYFQVVVALGVRVHPNSDLVAELLDYLALRGFDAAPRYLGRDERNRDVLSCIEGDTTDHPCQRRERAYVAGALMLRRLHDLTAGHSPATGNASSMATQVP